MHPARQRAPSRLQWLRVTLRECWGLWRNGDHRASRGAPSAPSDLLPSLATWACQILSFFRGSRMAL